MGSAFDILLKLAPELAGNDPRQIKTALEIAELQVGSVFGDLRDTAIAYLAAHMLTVSNQGGISGVIQSEKEGDLARTYFMGAASSSSVMSTNYGTEFKRLARMKIFSPRNRMV